MSSQRETANKPRRETTTELVGSLGFKLILNTASHPFEYAKVLIQLGHEPLPPYPTKSALFRKPVLGLPNVVEYVKHIKRADGFGGCYRGLSSRLIGNSMNFVTSKTVSYYAEQYLDEYFPDPSAKKAKGAQTEKEKWVHLCRSTIVELAGKTAGVIISHPFQVISVRIMAQFIAGENFYDGIFPSIVQVYRTDGILGYFAGLVPRLLGELLLTVFIDVCVFLAENYVNEPDITKFSSLPIAVVGSAFTYPFHVISSCMAVNNCGLAAGMPPLMPIYSSWIECWRHLARIDQTNRGASLFFRSYKGAHLSPTGYHNFIVRD